jgi:hypothetical protein
LLIEGGRLKKTPPQHWSQAVLEGLDLLDKEWHRGRLGLLECFQEAYDLFATDEVNAGKKLTETDIYDRFPGLVFEAGLHFGWISDLTTRITYPTRLQPNAYIDGATTNAPVTERIPDRELTASIWNIRMTLGRKADFLGYLERRQSYWLGRLYRAQAQDPVAAVEVGAPQAGKTYKSVLGRNIDQLRIECGWSEDELVEHTLIDKTLILRHINKGKGAYPSTLKKYADAFTKKLRRTITAVDLIS